MGLSAHLLAAEAYMPGIRKRTRNEKTSAGWLPLLVCDPVGSDGHCAVAWGDNSLHVFARGTDDVVWYKLDGRNWHSPGGKWQSRGKRILGRPNTVAWSENRLGLSAQGTDKAILHRGWDSQRWQNWESLGGRCKADIYISAYSFIGCPQSFLSPVQYEIQHPQIHSLFSALIYPPSST